MSTSCDTAIISRQIRCSILKSVVNGDWRKVFYNGITGNDRAARAEPSWLEFCRVKEEDESQINGITEIEFRAIPIRGRFTSERNYHNYHNYPRNNILPFNFRFFSGSSVIKNILFNLKLICSISTRSVLYSFDRLRRCGYWSATRRNYTEFNSEFYRISFPFYLWKKLS